MKLDLKILCACLALVYGNALADAGESEPQRKSSIGSFVKDFKETQRISSEKHRKAMELSPKWFAAAESGDLEEMKRIWKEFKYDDLYMEDDSGRTALEIAVTNGHADMVEWLADRTDECEKIYRASRFNLISLSKNRKPMMIIAAEKGYEDIIKIMLSRNLDCSMARDLSLKGKRKTPLIVAAERGYTNMVRLLLRNKKGYPDLVDDLDRSALMYASGKGYSDIVELLLDNDADPNKRDMWGDTALIQAVCYKEPSIAKSLLEHGADPNIKNKDKETALICAAKLGSYEMTKMLLEHGAKTDAKDKDKKTALDYAKKDPKIFDLLTDYANKPENQKTNLIKKAWNTVKKNVDQNLKNRRLSADSDATLYDEDAEQERDTDNLLSSTDTLVDD